MSNILPYEDSISYREYFSESKEEDVEEKKRNEEKEKEKKEKEEEEKKEQKEKDSKMFKICNDFKWSVCKMGENPNYVNPGPATSDQTNNDEIDYKTLCTTGNENFVCYDNSKKEEEKQKKLEQSKKEIDEQIKILKAEGVKQADINKIKKEMEEEAEEEVKGEEEDDDDDGKESDDEKGKDDDEFEENKDESDETLETFSQSVVYNELPRNPGVDLPANYDYKGYVYHGYTVDSGNGSWADRCDNPRADGTCPKCEERCNALSGCKGYTNSEGYCLYDTSSYDSYPQLGESNGNPYACWYPGYVTDSKKEKYCRFWKKSAPKFKNSLGNELDHCASWMNDQNCGACQEGGGYCQSCIDGYMMTENGCVQDNRKEAGGSCQNNGDCKSGKCLGGNCCSSEAKTNNCLSCTDNGLCSQSCADGYIWNSTSGCIKKPENASINIMMMVNVNLVNVWGKRHVW